MRQKVIMYVCLIPLLCCLAHILCLCFKHCISCNRCINNTFPKWSIDYNFICSLVKCLLNTCYIICVIPGDFIMSGPTVQPNVIAPNTLLDQIIAPITMVMVQSIKRHWIIQRVLWQVFICTSIYLKYVLSYY